MTQRRTRSAAALDQEPTPPRGRRRSDRISQGSTSVSAQSSSSQQAIDANPRSRSRKGKRKQPPDGSQSAGTSKRRISQRSTPLSAQSSSSQQAIDANPRSRSRKGKRKQPPDGSQSPGSSKRATTGSGVRTVGAGEPRPNDPPNLNQLKCFRISGLPSSWSANDLFEALHAIDPSLTRQNYRPSLYPACYNSTQIALLNLDPSTEHLQRHKHLQVSESASRTVALLTIDSQFYNLTPLNVPEGEVVAELVAVRALGTTHEDADSGCNSVIAVTGLAGHAFGSWRSRKTHQMWLKDFLAHDVPNIRILSYGYDSSLLGHGKAENRLLDYQRLLIQDIENARSSVKVGVLVQENRCMC